MSTNSRKKIKPTNCALCFGIPTSKKVFFEDQNNFNKDFAKHFNGVWYKYYHQFVSILENIEIMSERTGLKVIHDLTLNNFGQLFLNPKIDVIVLFSHWQGSKVEFYDGLAGFSDIINQIPDNFNGILDLCVCHPNDLALSIRKQKPNCLVKFIPHKATPSFWLYFYLVLFSYLEEKNITYLQALEQVAKEFLKENE